MDIGEPADKENEVEPPEKLDALLLVWLGITDIDEPPMMMMLATDVECVTVPEGEKILTANSQSQSFASAAKTLTWHSHQA